MSYTPSGPISMASINTALNYGSTVRISLNDSLVRKLQVATSGIAAGTPSSTGTSISMNSLKNKPGPDLYGTYETQSCSGYTLNVYNSDGSYGTYQASSTTNSPTCGYNPAGNSGLLISSTTFTVPSSSNGTIKVLCIGGGGAGGSGSARTSEYPSSGGGGGGSGEITFKTVTLPVGTVLTITVGAGGTAGSPTSGYYGGGSNSTGGSASTVKNGTTVIAGAGAGGAGGLSALAPGYPDLSNYSYYFNTFVLTPTGPFVSGGAGGSGAGGATGYTNPYTSEAGGVAGYVGYINGGYGGRGYTVSTTVGTSTIYGTGSRGDGGKGSDAGQYNNNLPGGLYYWLGGHTFNQPTQAGVNAGQGTIYGGGGGGGGKDNPYYASTSGINGANGGGGAVFIWWGY